ncbi:unnamed protein product [Rotaria magnacalcarata]|uniref:EGF-like domain-containing protein n=1 Tax=Rotaria magnacalcarata TaxID=392030 RepID=A0A816UU23_9BILA|nr:unnamed protein product [Rotaria magnacalcarata]CAF1930256.1 unnamed protein product [Rotaria magnacalcarata]CAF2114588.1 unnamed protein product [Rotaria magnacalcarata]CAF4301549.1 unnamed protein product [Rotaria magnacalcarata]
MVSLEASEGFYYGGGLGETDEKTFCLQAHPNDDSVRYRCWNDSKCVDFTSRYIPYLDDDDNICKAPDYDNVDRLDSRQAWLCNRGILIYYGKNESEQCLCPPSYYGDRCQYQNQRVSLTLQFRNDNLNKLATIGIVITLVDNTNLIHSHEQLTYIPFLDCNTKFNIYLLYRDRPKNMKKNYTIRIDAFDKTNLIYITSWTLPVKFNFMPVNHASTQLTIPARYHCHIPCNLRHHKQQTIVNIDSCQCPSKKSEFSFINQNKCDCSPDSICVGIINNRLICFLPFNEDVTSMFY